MTKYMLLSYDRSIWMFSTASVIFNNSVMIIPLK